MLRLAQIASANIGVNAYVNVIVTLNVWPSATEVGIDVMEPVRSTLGTAVMTIGEEAGAGFIAPSSGIVALASADSVIEEAEERSRHIGWLGHHDAAKPQLTAREMPTGQFQSWQSSKARSRHCLLLICNVVFWT